MLSMSQYSRSIASPPAAYLYSTDSPLVIIGISSTRKSLVKWNKPPLPTITWYVAKPATDVSLQPFKIRSDILLEDGHPINRIGKNQVGMKEVVLGMRTIGGWSQDSSLPRIRCHPIRTEARSHIGHWVILGDLVSLADTLTPFRRTKGNVANLYVYPFSGINCRFALHWRPSGKKTIPLPVLPSLHSVRVATLVK